jgi:hypothetical protein
MWELVDQIYITTYQGSPRIEECSKEISYWNIPPKKLTWNIRPKMEIPNCATSSAVKNHFEAFKHAKKNGYSNIIVLEDDFIMYDHSNSIQELEFKTTHFLQNYPDYDVLYYGYLPFQIDPDYNDYGIIKMYGILLHAYLINERFYSMFLELDSEFCVSSCCPFAKLAHDFTFFNVLYNQKRGSYGVYPQLVYQNNFPLTAIFKKDNTRKELFKNVVNVTTEMYYNGNLYKQIILIFIVIIILGKIK